MRELPSISLPCSEGCEISLSSLSVGTLALFFFPGTSDNIHASGDDTIQCRSYRGLALSSSPTHLQIAGVSTLTTEYSVDLATRENLTFPLLSDPDLKLGSLLAVPNLSIEGERRYPRLTMVALDGVITQVFYPIKGPHNDASIVQEWIEARC